MLYIGMMCGLHPCHGVAGVLYVSLTIYASLIGDTRQKNVQKMDSSVGSIAAMELQPVPVTPHHRPRRLSRD